MKTSNPLNIVFCDFDDIKNPLLGAGQAHATVEVGGRLAQMGHKVRVICSKFPGSKDRNENGLQYIHIGLGSSNIKLNNLIYILALPFTVMRLKADIIVDCFTAPISTLCSQLFTKIPVVGLPTSFDAERFSQLYHLPFTLIQNAGLRTYKYFMPYTQLLDDKFKKHNDKAKTKIIPEGVGAEYLEIKKQSPKHILFLGRFDMDQKGIDLLLQAFAQIKNEIKYPLVLAGYGPDEEKIKALVNTLGLGNHVHFVGGAFGDVKKKLLAESVAVAFPSRNEGFSLFSLEALASALPLIGFDIPGLCWTNDEIALKAKSFDVNEYAKLLKTVDNTTKINTMSKAARAFASHYTWDNVAQEFDRFFQAVHLEQGAR